MRTEADLTKFIDYYMAYHNREKLMERTFNPEETSSPIHFYTPLVDREDDGVLLRNGQLLGSEVCDRVRGLLSLDTLPDSAKMQHNDLGHHQKPSLFFAYPLINRLSPGGRAKKCQPLLTVEMTQIGSEAAPVMTTAGSSINWPLLHSLPTEFFPAGALQELQSSFGNRHATPYRLLAALALYILEIPQMASVEQFISVFNTKLAEYDMQQAYSADQTGVFYLGHGNNATSDLLSFDLMSMRKWGKEVPECLNRYLIGDAKLSPYTVSPSMQYAQIGSRVLTPSQLDAFCAAETNDLLAVNGPPGTGKTSLLVALAVQSMAKKALGLATRGVLDTTGSVVVVSTNNQAVDGFTENFDDISYMRDLGGRFCWSFGNQAKMLIIREQLDQLLRGLETAEPTHDVQACCDTLLSCFDSVKQKANTLAKVNVACEQAAEAAGPAAERLAQLKQHPILQWWVSLGEPPLQVLHKDFTNIMQRLHKKHKRPIWNVLSLGWYAKRYVPAKHEKLKRTLAKRFRMNMHAAETAPVLLPKALQTLTETLMEMEVLHKQICASAEDRFVLAVLANPDQAKNAAENALVDARQKLFSAAKTYMEAYAVANKTVVVEALKRIRTHVLESSPFRVDSATNNYCDEDFLRDIKWLYLVAPVITTTFHSFPKLLPWRIPGCIDRLIIDEAGQGLPYLALGALHRARHVVIVGDVEQLPPVRTVTSFTDKKLAQHAGLSNADYERSSSLTATIQSMAQSASVTVSGERGITLSEHFRCRPDIIAWCNEEVYNGKLKTVEREYGAERILDSDDRRQCLYFYDIDSDGVFSSTRGSKKNDKEADFIGRLVAKLFKLYEQNNLEPSDRIGVITPFLHQRKAIEQALHLHMGGKARQVAIGTIHAFQGSERDIIILSLVYAKSDKIDPHLFFFNLDTNKSLFNVAISRAKEYLICVGDQEVATKAEDTFSARLVNYIRARGKIFKVQDRDRKSTCKSTQTV